MPLTLKEQDTLTTDANFLARTRSAVRKYAAYCVALAGSATTQQQNWAKAVFQLGKGAQIAADMAPELVQATNVVASALDAQAGSTITDANLESAVEAIALKYGV